MPRFLFLKRKVKNDGKERGKYQRQRRGRRESKGVRGVCICRGRRLSRVGLVEMIHEGVDGCGQTGTGKGSNISRVWNIQTKDAKYFGSQGRYLRRNERREQSDRLKGARTWPTQVGKRVGWEGKKDTARQDKTHGEECRYVGSSKGRRGKKRCMSCKTANQETCSSRHCRTTHLMTREVQP